MNFYGTLVFAMLMVLAMVSATIPGREISIIEEDAIPGIADAPCTDAELAKFSKKISDGLNECDTKTDYVWTGTALATARQRSQLCDCEVLAKQLQTIPVPRCTLIKNRQTMTLAASMYDAFQDCFFDTPTYTPPVSSSAPPVNPTPSPRTESGKPNYFVIGGSIVGVVLVIAIVAWVVCKWRKKSVDAERDRADDRIIDASPLSPMNPRSDYVSVAVSSKTRDTNSTSTTTNGSSYTSRESSRVSRAHVAGTPSSTKQALQDDPIIAAVRVPMEAVFFGPIFACGGFGEVYKGTYNGETVAIKRLLPSRRKDITEIENFLGEVKLMASLDHERIVRFIGVAWNSLSEACAVVEFMDNGDLRSVLTRWDGEEMRPHGFDADKVKIALHVAHALTYLHSLQPVVVHRDLKSKNILLTASLDAKLTDFGVSRERADSTMTAGVGSSLWMAPEVMMGERYNEKADVFSFGVVLSELDSHQLPYAHAKPAAPDQRIPDSAILHMVSLGRLRVSFSDHADADLVALGYDCVQVDPTKRPTVAEVLHRVHQAFRRFQVARS